MKRFAILAVLTLCASLTFAQTPQGTGITVGTYGGAMGVCFSGTCNAGSVSVQSLSITSALNVEATQYVVPGANLQGYFAGISYALPLDAFLAKATQLPVNTFRVSLHGAPGVVLNSSSGAKTKFGAFGGGELDIAPTSDGKFVFGPRVDAVYAPGVGSSPVGFAYSLNIGYLFGGTISPVTSAVAGPRSTLRRVWGTKAR